MQLVSLSVRTCYMFKVNDVRPHFGPIAVGTDPQQVSKMCSHFTRLETFRFHFVVIAASEHILNEEELVFDGIIHELLIVERPVLVEVISL